MAVKKTRMKWMILTMMMNGSNNLAEEMKGFFSHSVVTYIGMVRLASLCQPGGLILTRPKQTILALSWWRHAPVGAAPSDPFHKQGIWGWPRWAPGMTSKLFELTGGRPGSNRRSQSNAPIIYIHNYHRQF